MVGGDLAVASPRCTSSTPLSGSPNRAFGSVPVADDVDNCGHRVDPERVEALRRVPLTHLTAEQLGPLLFKP